MYLMHPSCSESSNLCWGPATSTRQPAFCHFLHMMCQTTAHRACGVVHCITQSDERARPLVISSWIGKRQQRATAYNSRHLPHDNNIYPSHPFTASTRAEYIDQTPDSAPVYCIFVSGYPSISSVFFKYRHACSSRKPQSNLTLTIKRTSVCSSKSSKASGCHDRLQGHKKKPSTTVNPDASAQWASVRIHVIAAESVARSTH